MRIVEYQHRCEGGGNDVHLDCKTWEHGESVVILSTRELKDEIRLAIHEASGQFPSKAMERLSKMLRLLDNL